MWGAWLTQLVDHVALNLIVRSNPMFDLDLIVRPNPMLGMELISKK